MMVMEVTAMAGSIHHPTAWTSSDKPRIEPDANAQYRIIAFVISLLL
jgi:hypothetical protein